MEVVFDNHVAFAKLLCHACKYPSNSINGVLLGRIESGNLIVQDSIPMFHDHLNLAPMTEFAFRQVCSNYSLSDN
jgi:hypothetical protein